MGLGGLKARERAMVMARRVRITASEGRAAIWSQWERSILAPAKKRTAARP